MKIIKDQTLSGRSRVEKDGKGFVSAGPPTKSRTWCLGKSIDLQVGVCALPHPYKMPDDVANSRRDYGPGKETCTDVSLSEDSHFMARLSWPTENSDYVTYVGVADGVGSWRGVGVDPRDYSQRIIACAQVSCLRIHRCSSTPATYHPHHPPLTTHPPPTTHYSARAGRGADRKLGENDFGGVGRIARQANPSVGRTDGRMGDGAARESRGLMHRVHCHA